MNGTIKLGATIKCWHSSVVWAVQIIAPLSTPECVRPLGVCVGLCLVAGCLSSHVLEIIVRWIVALILIYLGYFDA